MVDSKIVTFKHQETSFARLQQRPGISDPDHARCSLVAVFFYSRLAGTAALRPVAP
jgi:bifunctional non-homologous end joining protein LigD